MTAIERLLLPLRPYHVLVKAGIDSVEQLVGMTKDDVAALHQLGVKGLRQIEDALKAHGYSFAS